MEQNLQSRQVYALSWATFLLPLILLTNHAEAQDASSTTSLVATTSPQSSDSSITNTRTPTLSNSVIPSSFNPSGFAMSNTPTGAMPTGSSCNGNNGVCRGNEQDNDSGSGSEAYYFIFIAIFFVLVGGMLWGVNQRKRRRTAQNTSVRRSALERDMQNAQFDQLFPNSRRWTGEGRRSGARSSGGGLSGPRRDEGLNEVGEAPPPYKPAGAGNGQMNGAGITIPMQTFQPDDRNKPPEYDTSVGHVTTARDVEDDDLDMTRPTRTADAVPRYS